MGHKRIINEKPLTCPHCGGQDFETRPAQLQTRGLALFNLEWMAKTATVFICDSCGRLEWFLDVNGG
jgi:predicted RNA-binding Zn-ribbon protein involved in translation (DUF1610 family)